MRTLIKNGYIFTLDPQRRVFERGDVLVVGERIAAIGANLDESERPEVLEVSGGSWYATYAQEERVIDATHCLVLPGMVNASLVPQSGLWKGLFGEREIQAVLDGMQADGAGQEDAGGISNPDMTEEANSGPEDKRNLAADLTYNLTLLAGIEMLRCGVTTVAHQPARITQNTPPVMDAITRAYRDLGIRAVIPEDLPENGLPESRRDVVVYSPLSELHSGEPLLPIHKYRAAGTALALGTGAFNGGNHNMFDALKMAFAMQRILQPDYNLWPTVEQILEMATANGARYCGLENETGSLEVGKQADIALYDVRGFSFSPLNNPLDQFVCLEDGSSLALLMVGGKMVFEYGQVLTVDEAVVKQRVNTLYAHISQSQAVALREG